MGPKKAPEQPEVDEKLGKEVDDLFGPFMDPPFSGETASKAEEAMAATQEPAPSVDAATPLPLDDEADRPTPVWDPPADLGLPTPLLPSVKIDGRPVPMTARYDFSGSDAITLRAPDGFDAAGLFKLDTPASVSPVDGATATQIAVMAGTHPSLRSAPIPRMYVVGDGAPQEDAQNGGDAIQHLSLPNLVLSPPPPAAIQAGVKDAVNAAGRDETPEIEIVEDVAPDVHGDNDLPPVEDAPVSGAEEANVTPVSPHGTAESIPSLPPLPLVPPPQAVEQPMIDPQDQCFMLLQEMDINFPSLDRQIQRFRWKNRLLEPLQIQGVFLYILHQFFDHLSRHLQHHKTNVVQTKMGILTGKLVHRIAQFEKEENDENGRFILDENTQHKINSLRLLLDSIPQNPSIEQLADAFIDQADFSGV